MKVEIDGKDFEQLRRALLRVPGDIQTKAMGRAMRRLSQMARTRIVNQTTTMTRMPKSVVASVTTAHFNAGGNTQKIIVQSGWIPLMKLGAVQNASGVYVNLRGSYAHAFVASMKSGHVGVFRRGGDHRRFPIHELFGANPANAITNKPEEYLDTMAELMAEYFLPRLIHEVDRLLPGK